MFRLPDNIAYLPHLALNADEWRSKIRKIQDNIVIWLTQANSSSDANSVQKKAFLNKLSVQCNSAISIIDNPERWNEGAAKNIVKLMNAAALAAVNIAREEKKKQDDTYMPPTASSSPASQAQSSGPGLPPAYAQATLSSSSSSLFAGTSSTNSPSSSASLSSSASSSSSTPITTRPPSPGASGT